MEFLFSVIHQCRIFICCYFVLKMYENARRTFDLKNILLVLFCFPLFKVFFIQLSLIAFTVKPRCEDTLYHQLWYYKADKVNKTVILNEQEYIDKCLILLNDEKVCKKLNR